MKRIYLRIVRLDIYRFFSLVSKNRMKIGKLESGKVPELISGLALNSMSCSPPWRICDLIRQKLNLLAKYILY